MTPKEIVHKMFDNDPFSKWLGINVDNIAEGTCQLSMTIRQDMLNGFGIAHGGITYSLADSALAFAANTHGRQSVSVDTSINHIEALKEDDKIIAVATEESLKNRFGFYKIEIKRDDTIVALFKGTVYRTNKDWE
jgi:acyl-CoA thioesterase